VGVKLGEKLVKNGEREGLAAVPTQPSLAPRYLVKRTPSFVRNGLGPLA
jgi:hypothetical protein